MTEKTLGIAKAFVEAQKEFEKTGLEGKNPHFRSNYARLDACVAAVKPALNKHGIALIQKTHECENGVKVETIFMHETGEQISGGLLYVPSEQQSPQKYGSALTYARRYSLLTACGVPPEEKLDDDAEVAEQPYRETKSMAEKLPQRKAPEEVKKP
jgi:hypothetical protein